METLADTGTTLTDYTYVQGYMGNWSVVEQDGTEWPWYYSTLEDATDAVEWWITMVERSETVALSLHNM